MGRDKNALKFYNRYKKDVNIELWNEWSKDKEIRVKPRENFVEDFYYPQNVKLEKSGRYAVAAFTKVSGKPIRTFVKVDKGIIMVK